MEVVGSVKRLPASTGGLSERQHACPLTRMGPGGVKIFGTLIWHPFGPPYGSPRGVTSHIAYKTCHTCSLLNPEPLKDHDFPKREHHDPRTR